MDSQAKRHSGAGHFKSDLVYFVLLVHEIQEPDGKLGFGGCDPQTFAGFQPGMFPKPGRRLGAGVGNTDAVAETCFWIEGALAVCTL
jgi:hypothetical protein